LFCARIYPQFNSALKEKMEIETNQKDLAEKSSRVKITDINMPFWSMVIFMVKWAIASIPAIIILMLLFMFFGGFVTTFSSI
tara:strand:+ start:366 stop:611 length:246 start_codon:yes stop_codon:yes gene_type:complete